MARPKKKPEPEPQKIDWFKTTVIILAVIVFGALAIAYNNLRMHYNDTATSFAHHVDTLDKILVKQRKMIEELQQQLSVTTITLVKERETYAAEKEVFDEKEQSYREAIDILRADELKLKEKVEKLEVEIQKKSKARIIRPRGNGGVVRPRVYKW